MPGPGDALGADHGRALLGIADAAVSDGLAGRPLRLPAPGLVPGPLRAVRGVFVTLEVGGELNGCLGSIEGTEPLAAGTARHARGAAFSDPRLPALRPRDYGALSIEVSVLSDLAPLGSASRSDVVGGTRPGTDGLVVESAGRRAVFLPAVWEQLPDPDDFLDHLLAKAGLSPRRWPGGLRAWTFTVEKFCGPAGAAA